MSTGKKPRGRLFRKGADPRRNAGGRLPTAESPTAHLRAKMAEVKGGRSRAERIAERLAARAERGSDAATRTVLDRVDGQVDEKLDVRLNGAVDGGLGAWLAARNIDVSSLYQGEQKEIEAEGLPPDVHLMLRRDMSPEEVERIDKHLSRLIMGEPGPGIAARELFADMMEAVHSGKDYQEAEAELTAWFGDSTVGGE